MAIITKTSAKAYFQTGNFPTQAQFADTIDSYLGLGESALQSVSGNVNFTAGVQVSGNQVRNAAYATTGARIISSAGSLDLANTTVSAGTYTNPTVTFDATGRATAASNGGTSNVTAVTVVTDTTDIALSAAPTQTNVGSTFSMTIPTKGIIVWNVTCEVICAVGIATLIFGLRIGSTNYWPTSIRSGSTGYSLTGNSVGSGQTDIISSIGVFSGVTNSGATSNLGGSQPAGIGIEASGIPTGVQTVQVIAGLTTSASGTLTLKGTVVTTRVYITMEDHS